ncbi:hypothetical protein A4X09_0g1949 [Tilletia walkeri]|uniref:Copper transporter n=1 Tax=Tilletia walkeri TaxID=117179 RepID=A0A8X7T6L4_9BASI|nr:hypothetical protein A4X09_0g1949 [Tilletia walkeri]
MPSATEAPRCPLGFTGTPPAGHPTIPGLSSSHSPTSKQQHSHLTSIQTFISNILAQPWSNTHTMLVLDALFILAATLVAIYWDRIPGLKGLKAGGPRAGAGAAGQTAASSAAVAGGSKQASS